jgi:starch synthase
MDNLSILVCSPEIVPFAKTGGLADVSAALPEALSVLGCDVRLVLPLYRSARERAGPLKALAREIPVLIGGREYHVNLWQGLSASGIIVYFVEKDEFFDRSQLYGSAHGDYEDNADRYIAFCQAIAPLCASVDWYPSILHAHDWQTALIPAYWFFLWRDDAHWASTATVFTIHNLAYQGIFPAPFFSLTRLPNQAFAIHGLEFFGNCSFLKAGIVYTDIITTVSPRYSQEIQKPELGCGLDGLLREQRHKLVGILNGVDYRIWNPQTDPAIPVRYDVERLSGKARCKEQLLARLELPTSQLHVPLLGMITRLVSQKGVDLLREALDDLLALSMTLVILGTGDMETEAWLQRESALHPGKLKVVSGFDEDLAHWIEAGADIFLMPSQFEPCGLNQMYSLRYGTIPVVHATGGLDDSIVDVMLNPHTGTGFKFYQYTAFDFLYTTRSAVELYHDRDTWQQLQRRAMTEDFSWERSARSYLEVYHQALALRRPGLWSGEG